MRSFVKSVVAVVICVAVCNFAIANNHHNHRHGAAKSASALPAWSLKDTNQKVVSSDQLSGQAYVLVLHLGKGCLHCAQQLHAVENHAVEIRSAGAEVIAVSTDDANALAEQLESFGDSFSLKLVSDDELNLFRGVGAYDAVGEKPLHATMVVDGAGRIRWSNIAEHPFMAMEQLIEEVHLVNVGATTTQEDQNPQAPKIFLDKPARIVAYQLKRLSNDQLLMVGRKTDDQKYAPVWSAILTRDGMDGQYRKQALNALVTLNESSAVDELIAALANMKSNTRPEKRSCRELANMLLRMDAGDLAAAEDQLVTSTSSTKRDGFKNE